MSTNLSPRRQRYAEQLLRVLHWRGGKLWVTDQTYRELWRMEGMRRSDVDLAVDDLFSTGAADVHLAGDAIQIVEARRRDVDAVSRASTPVSEPATMKAAAAGKVKPQIVLASGRRGRA
jgi:hypothetical protein